MIKKSIFQCFWNETDRFLECMYISLASKSCNEFFTVKFRTVFKLFRYRVNASSNFATVTFFTVFKMCRHRVNAVLGPVHTYPDIFENASFFIRFQKDSRPHEERFQKYPRPHEDAVTFKLRCSNFDKRKQTIKMPFRWPQRSVRMLCPYEKILENLGNSREKGWQ